MKRQARRIGLRLCGALHERQRGGRRQPVSGISALNGHRNLSSVRKPAYRLKVP